MLTEPVLKGKFSWSWWKQCYAVIPTKMGTCRKRNFSAVPSYFVFTAFTIFNNLNFFLDWISLRYQVIQEHIEKRIIYLFIYLYWPT